MALQLLLHRFAASAVTESLSAPSPSPLHTLDPLNAPSYGYMLSPSRQVLKLDCPGCPMYNPSWDSKVTALIYDFTIAPRADDDVDADIPQIFLNNNRFYPPYTVSSLESLTVNTVLPVPYTTTIGSYLCHPDAYRGAEVRGVFKARNVENPCGWNLTQFTLFLNRDGSDEGDVLENRWDNVSVVDIFLRRMNTSDMGENMESIGREGEMNEVWTLEWWQMVPHQSGFANGTTDHGPAMLPAGLRDKLLGNGTIPGLQPGANTVESRPLHMIRSGLVLFSALGMAYVLVVMLHALIKSGAARSRRRNQGTPPRKLSPTWKRFAAWSQGAENGSEDEQGGLLLDIDDA